MIIPEDADDEESDEPVTPPPPPEDRLWRHPAEMRFSGSRQRHDPPGSIRPHGAIVPPSYRSSGPGTHRRSRLSFLAGVCSGAAALAIALAGAHLIGGAPSASNAKTASNGRPVAGQDLSAVGKLKALPAGSALVAELRRLQDSLVTLHVTGPHRFSRWGTGVVIGPRDTVLTSDTLLTGGTKIVALTTSGKKFSAKVVGEDSETGVAVVRLPGTGIQPVSLAPVGRVSSGELAIAVGAERNPRDLEVAIGPVTFRDRHTMVSTGSGEHFLLDAMGIQAPVGSTGAGGIVIDPRGRLLGTVASVEGSGSSATVVAVPIELAAGVAEEIEQNGSVAHGWLGIDGATASAPSRGAVITKVEPGSPAQKAGLRPGDVIEEVDGQPISSLASLQEVLYLIRPGAQVTLTVVAGGRPNTVITVLAGSPR